MYFKIIHLMPYNIHYTLTHLSHCNLTKNISHENCLCTINAHVSINVSGRISHYRRNIIIAFGDWDRKENKSKTKHWIKKRLMIFRTSDCGIVGCAPSNGYSFVQSRNYVIRSTVPLDPSVKNPYLSKWNKKVTSFLNLKLIKLKVYIIKFFFFFFF